MSSPESIVTDNYLKKLHFISAKPVPVAELDKFIRQLVELKKDAEKWRKCTADFNIIIQNQKLIKLVEEEIEKIKDYKVGSHKFELRKWLQNLLEQSKKKF